MRLPRQDRPRSFGLGRLPECLARGRPAGQPAEYRTRSQSRSARIVDAEDAADHFAGGIEPRNRLKIEIDHLRRRRLDAQAAEGEGDAAADMEGFEWRLVDFQSPVRFRNLQPDR